ncbi:MAG TPA: alpha/beta fold hydrolase [Candidatus Angelobacter sp.]
MASTQIVQAEGARIEVITHGKAARPTRASLVALACGGGSVLAKLSWPVAEMQMRGYGESVEVSKGRWNSGAPRLSDHVGDIDSVFNHFKLERPVLLGYSHGGYFATAYALANPARVAGLILVEPALFNSRDELLLRARLAREAGSEESMKSMLRHVQPSIGMNEGRAAKTAKVLLKNVRNADTLANEFLVRAENPISEDDLAGLKMPVLLVGGTKSHASYTVTKLARILPSASLWWVRDVEHLELLAESVSQQLSPVIDSFVAGLK